MDGAGMSAWLRHTARTARVRLARLMWSEHGRRYYVLAVLAVAALSAAMSGVGDELGVLNVRLLYLLLTFGLALGLGAGPAAVAAVLGFLTFDSVSIPPKIGVTLLVMTGKRPIRRSAALYSPYVTYL